MMRHRATPSVRQRPGSCLKMKALVMPGVTRLQLSAAQHQQSKQTQQHSRVPLCTAVLSSSSSSSSPSPTQQLRHQLGISSRMQLAHSSRFSRMRCHVVPPLAMVNVDFASPSLVLGVTLIGCGIALLQVRNMQREVSRDADIVVAAMISIVGSTLIFQGWRLDPLLLLCQALTTSVAFWYGLEAFKLRAEVVQDEEGNMQGQQMPPLQDMPPGMQQQDYQNAARSGYLPPAGDRPAAPWAQQQQQQPGAFGPGSSTRWGLPPAGQQSGLPYDAFAGSSSSSSMGPMQDAAYAGYEQEAGSSGGQQQYMPGAGGYGGSSSSGGYSNGAFDAAGGMYGVPPPGQQQQQYDWPSGGYQQQQPLGAPTYPQQQQQQPGWYDPAGMPLGPDGQPLQQQLPYGGLPGLADPYTMPGAAPGDGSLLPGGYGPDGSTGLPLPPPADGQQQGRPGHEQAQQRRAQGGGRNAYEQVDDWE